MEYIFTEENFEQEVLQAELPVLVDFYADWCGPCKMMAPVIEQLAEKYEGKMKVGKLDVDAAMDLSMKYKVVSIPCFKVFKGGEVVLNLVGAMSAASLCEQLESVLN